MKTIVLDKILDLRDYASPGPNERLSVQAGGDGNLYLLLQKKPPEPIVSSGGAVFPNPHADSEYTVVAIEISPAVPASSPSGTVTAGAAAASAAPRASVIPLKESDCHFSFVRPLGDRLLLVGARCFFDSAAGRGEDNAYLYDRSGNLLRRMCLGDGISRVLTYPDGRIVVGYFDEGIFGNYGWDDPLGSSGIVVWDENGHVLWENPDPDEIADVYDLEYGADGAFWYYAYDEFNFVHVDRTYRKTVFETDGDGCSRIAFVVPGGYVLFDGGYDGGDTFFTGVLKKNPSPDGPYGQLTEKEPVTFLCDGNPVEIQWFESAGGRVFAIGSGGSVYLLGGIV